MPLVCPDPYRAVGNYASRCSTSTHSPHGEGLYTRLSLVVRFSPGRRLQHVRWDGTRGPGKFQRDQILQLPLPGTIHCRLLHLNSRIFKTLWSYPISCLMLSSCLPCNTTTHHTVTILHHTVPHHTIPHHSIPYHAMPWPTIPCNSILYTITYYNITYQYHRAVTTVPPWHILHEPAAQ